MPAFFQHARLRIFLLSIPFDESLLIRLLIRCFDMPFSVRAPLHNLFAFVHPKVVSVFSKLSSQRIDGYNNFCYHISPFFVLLRIESVVSSRPFRDHPERHAYVRDPFFESRCKYTMNKLYFANFFAKKCIFLIFRLPTLAKSQNCITMWLQRSQIDSHYNNILYYIMPSNDKK